MKVWHQFFIFAVLEAGTCKNLSNSAGLGIGPCKGFSIDTGRISGMWIEEIYLSILPSFCPSFLLSGSFLGDSFFSETEHVVRGPCSFVPRGARFFEKKNFISKNREHG